MSDNYEKFIEISKQISVFLETETIDLNNSLADMKKNIEVMLQTDTQLSQLSDIAVNDFQLSPSKDTTSSVVDHQHHHQPIVEPTVEQLQQFTTDSCEQLMELDVAIATRNFNESVLLVDARM